MNESQNNSKGRESPSWRYVVDKVVDLISSSKSTLRFLNEKLTITDETKAEAAKQTAKDVIKRKLLKEFLKTKRNIDDKLTQLHINESFPEKSESNVRCSTIYNESQFEKFSEPPNNQQPTSNFLDEQYKLTKQAIAIRYMPQMKINFISTKNSLLKDHLHEPPNNKIHRISSVASEKIPVYLVKKRPTKKIEKGSPGTAEKSSNKNFFVKNDSI